MHGSIPEERIKNITGLFHCRKYLETKGLLNDNRIGNWEAGIKINIHKDKDAQHLHRSKILGLRQEREDKGPEDNGKSGQAPGSGLHYGWLCTRDTHVVEYLFTP